MSARLLASAIVRTLALPPFNFFLLAAFGWLLSRRMPRTGRAIAILALVMLFLVCTDFFANLLVLPLESRTTPLSSQALADSDAQAIVVLTAGRLREAPEYGGKDIPDYIALARIRYAARLQHQTNLPLLVSGGNFPFDAVDNTLAASMATALREDFRTPVRWAEDRSNTTAENAAFSAAMLKRDGVSRILLVTDAMHMPRAQRAFEQAGLQVTAAPTMFFGRRRFEPMSLVPSAEGLRRAYYAFYEWLGLVWYSQAGANAGLLKTS
jgi:uncharacterized SAM-binding protein YcdF (DUF218 family)